MINLSDSKTWGVALGALAISSFALLPEARGELVYEDEASHPAVASPVSVPPEEVPAQETVSRPESFLSKMELLRRARVREELKNEDLLQGRLEELRLRDEQRRTEQLVGVLMAGEGAPSGSAVTASTGSTASVMKEEFVVPPVTERPGQTGESLPEISQPQEASEQVALSSDLSTPEKGPALGVSLSVMPRAGISSMAGSYSFDIHSKYTAGVSIGVGVSDSMALEVGYAYTDFGVSLASTSPWVQNYAYTHGYFNRDFESYAMKQNVVDGGMKFQLLGPTAKVRPFVGGGAAYSKSFVNYDHRILESYDGSSSYSGGSEWASDYEISSFLGYLSTGMDIRLSPGISVGAVFKYYAVLSARESGAALASPAGGYQPYYGSYGTSPEFEKLMVGSTLARASFYSILAGASFSF